MTFAITFLAIVLGSIAIALLGIAVRDARTNLADWRADQQHRAETLRHNRFGNWE